MWGEFLGGVNRDGVFRQMENRLWASFVGGQKDFNLNCET